MLLRLFPQILFREKLAGSPVLVSNFYRLEATLYNLPHPEQVNFRKSALEMMLAAVAIGTEQQHRKEPRKVLVRNLATLCQELLGDLDR